jgi:ribonucleoside-triphosphate reductase (formate)
VRCCSVMPQSDTSAYEYQPEEMVEKSRYEMVCAAIKEDEMKEDIGLEHVDCDSGACPISFNENQ